MRLGGTTIELHPSLIAILVLAVIVLATSLLPGEERNSSYSTLEFWMLGVLGAGVLFVSLLLHELAHLVAARMAGQRVETVTLLFLHSAHPALPEEDLTPWKDMFIAAAGPAITLALGLGAWLLEMRFSEVRFLAPLLEFCAVTNILLALVQLVPGFPLDGGRLLRGMAWGLAGDPTRGTRWAAHAAFAFAVVLGLACVATLLFGGMSALPLWGLLMALVLAAQARGLARMARVRSRLSGLVVGQVMEPLPAPLPRIMSVAEALIAGAAAGASAFLVEFQGRLGGIVTLGALQAVPEDERWQTPVGQVTRKLEKQHLIAPGMPLESAVRRLVEEQLPLLPVLSNGALIGVLRHEAVANLFEGSERDR